MKNKIYIVLAFVVTAMASCTKDATVKVPEVDSKLAVFCFINPSDTFYNVKVETSTPLYQGKITPGQDMTVRNATVIISQGGQSINLVYNDAERMYKAPVTLLPIVSGRTYLLTVEDQEGRKVKAETMVPMPADLHAKLEADSSAGGDTYTVSFAFTDPHGEGNYYRLLMTNRDSVLVNPDSNIYETYEYSLSDDYYNDKGKDGVTITKFIPNKDAFSTSPLYTNPRNVRALMLLGSREYHLYHQSIYAQNSGGGPFSEPTQSFTNIQPYKDAKNGGVGCFGAFLYQEYHF